MSTEIANRRRRLVEFLIQSTNQLELPPIVKYTALSFFFDRFLPSVVRFLPKEKAERWLLQPLTESNLQLFASISIWISCKIHCTEELSVHSLKYFGDKVILDEIFVVRDFLDAELVFLKVLKFEIGTLNLAYTQFEDLFIQFREVAQVGEHLDFEACMDMMDILYEKEETSLLFQSSKSLAASILVSSYIITVPKHQYEFPILPWVKMVTNKEENEVVELVGYILDHVIHYHPP